MNLVHRIIFSAGKIHNRIEITNKFKDNIMGFVVLHLDKSPGNEAPMTAHIARTVMSPNADPARTHLNKNLMEFPDGIKDRTEAIRHRLENAGLERKIGKNQVQVIRVMLTGSHEDMKLIEAEGRLDDWCRDNLDWLAKTFGKENVVSATLHMDEDTPHIHASVVPIVTGERRKKKSNKPKPTDKKKYRKKSREAPRLCADDVMARDRLKGYQDSYAEAMGKYGLQRGIDGSEARHISTSQYYRDLVIKSEDLKETVEIMQEQKEEVNEKIRDLYDRKDKAREKFLNMDEYVRRKEKELEEVKTKLEQAKHEIDPNNVRSDFNLMRELFPKLDELLKQAKFCLKVGFTKEMASMLVNEKPVRFSGALYSHEYERKFQTEQSTARIEENPKEQGKFRLMIDGLHVVDWFRQKYREMQKAMGIHLKERPEVNRNKGIKM
jgi:hypothetical protein